MNLTTNQVQGRVSVTVLAIQGDLDGSNYLNLIAKVKELYQSGTRHLLLDMGGVSYMSSSGLVALHSAALLMRGDQAPDPQNGWAAIHSVSEEPSEAQTHVKLLNLQPRVNRSLELAGIKDSFECYTDLAAAIASF